MITLTEIQAILGLKNTLTPQFRQAVADVKAGAKQIFSDVTGAGASFDQLAATVKRSAGQVDTDLRQLRQKVADLRLMIDANSSNPTFAASLIRDLDATLPKLNAVEAEARKLASGTDAATKASQGFGASLGSLNGVLGVFGVTLSAAAVVGFGKSVLDTMGHLQDLHEATGVSTDQLQRLGQVGREAGADVDVMSRAVQTLSDKIASGDANDQLAMLGLNIQKIRSMNPGDAFVEVGTAVGKMTDTMGQAEIAADLFGGRLGKQLIPTLGNLKEKLAEVDPSLLFDPEDIKKADEFGEALDRLILKTKVWAVEAVKAAAQVPNFLRLLVTGDPSLLGNTPSGPGGSDFAVPRQIPPPVAPPTDGTADRIQQMKNLVEQYRKDALVPLTDAMKAQIAEAVKWGVSEDKIAKLLDTNVTAVHLYAEKLKESQAAAKQHGEAIEKVRDASTSYGAALVSVNGYVADYVTHLLSMGVSQKDVALALGLTETQVRAVAESVRVASDLQKLYASTTVATVDQLGKLGVAEADVIGQVKSSQAAREALNSTHVLSAETLRNLGRVEVDEIVRVKQMADVWLRLKDIQGQANEANLTGLENVGRKVAILSADQMQHLAEVEEAAKRQRKALGDLAQAFALIGQASGGALDEFLGDVGNVITSLNLAATAAENFRKADGDLLTQVSSVAAGIGAVAQATSRGSAAVRAFGGAITGLQVGAMFGPIGAGIGAVVGGLTGLFRGLFGGISQAEQEGRKVVEDFEKQFKSTADMINTVGEAYLANGKTAEQAQAAVQKLWDAEKQGADATKQALEEINAELEHHKQVVEGAAKYGPSKEQAKEAERLAHEIFDYMLKSGQYTQKQLDAAYMDWQKALAAAGDKAAEAWVKAHNAAAAGMDQASQALKELEDRKKSLEQSYANEAPEEQMGLIEAAARAQVDSINAQMDAIRKQAEDATQAAEDAAGDQTDAADQAAKDAAASYDEAARSMKDALNSVPTVASGVRGEIDRIFSGMRYQIKFDVEPPPAPARGGQGGQFVAQRAGAVSPAFVRAALGSPAAAPAVGGAAAAPASGATLGALADQVGMLVRYLRDQQARDIAQAVIDRKQTVR